MSNSTIFKRDFKQHGGLLFLSEKFLYEYNMAMSGNILVNQTGLLEAHRGAERQRRHSHAERRNEKNQEEK